MTAIPLARNVGERQACAIAEIAAAEKINESHVGRVLRLTLLAPDIVEAILGGRQPAQMTLAVLMRPFPSKWKRQRNGSQNAGSTATGPADQTVLGHSVQKLNCLSL